MAKDIPPHIDQIIRSRRSTYPRQFTGEKIGREIIESLLENANWAPNHKHTEPWRFKIFEGTSKEVLIDKTREIYLKSLPKANHSAAKLRNFELKKEKTSHVLAIVVSYDAMKRVPEWEEMAAVACAVQNIYLSLSSHGIAGYWSTGTVVDNQELRDFLKLKENENCIGLFYLGIPGDVDSISQRQPYKSKVEWHT